MFANKLTFLGIKYLLTAINFIFTTTAAHAYDISFIIEMSNLFNVHVYVTTLNGAITAECALTVLYYVLQAMSSYIILELLFFESHAVQVYPPDL